MDTTYCLGTDRDAAGSAGQAGAPGFGTAQDERDASRTPPQTLSVQERRALISEAAHRRAARRGFTASITWQDWWAAECEVNAVTNSHSDV